MSRTRTSIAVPAGARAYTGAISALTIARASRLSLVGAADDVAAVYLADDPLLEPGTSSEPFSAASRNTWPPGCHLIAVLGAGGVAYVPDELWGPHLVVQRVAGSSGVVWVSGEGAQSQRRERAPGLGLHEAYDVASFLGSVQVAVGAGVFGVYLTDDEEITVGSGPPPGQYVGQVSLGRALTLPFRACAVVLHCLEQGTSDAVFLSGIESATQSNVLAYAERTEAITVTNFPRVEFLACDPFTPDVDEVTVTFTATYGGGNSGTASFWLELDEVKIGQCGETTWNGRVSVALVRRVPVVRGVATTIRVTCVTLQSTPITCAPSDNDLDQASILVTR